MEEMADEVERVLKMLKNKVHGEVLDGSLRIADGSSDMLMPVKWPTIKEIDALIEQRKQCILDIKKTESQLKDLGLGEYLSKPDT